MFLHGMRWVEPFTRDNGRIETFSLTPNRIWKDGMVLFEEPVMRFKGGLLTLELPVKELEKTRKIKIKTKS